MTLDIPYITENVSSSAQMVTTQATEFVPSVTVLVRHAAEDQQLNVNLVMNLTSYTATNVSNHAQITTMETLTQELVTNVTTLVTSVLELNHLTVIHAQMDTTCITDGV